MFLRRLCKSGDLKTRFWGEPLENFLRTMLSRNIHRVAVGRMFFFAVLAVGDMGEGQGIGRRFKLRGERAVKENRETKEGKRLSLSV